MLSDSSIFAALPDGAPAHKPSLLMVDDQTVNIHVMYRAFAEDCQVFKATNGKTALQLCVSKLPDLVLLDIEMPEMDGFEVCRRLKANETTRNIPVIFVTSHSDPEKETLGLELGAVDFISKPINPSVLRARVRTHLLLKYQSDALRSLAFRDGLTTLYNRRFLDHQLEMKWSRSVRQASSLAIILLDVDFFKRYNDHYGHQTGDDCLREIASTVKGSLRRKTDIAARYGGEEFICLLPETSQDNAMEIAEKISKRLQERALRHLYSDVSQYVTLSMGVASSIGGELEAEQLIALADQRLYNAKNSGRARVCGETPAVRN
ncbi:MAG: diguanylate cyclase [Rhodoferax sp.]|jgi:diguanylate cyclase (GGDEF)-like protein